MLILFLVLAIRLLKRKGTGRPASNRFAPPARSQPGSLSRRSALSGAAGTPPENGMPNQAASATGSALNRFHLFNEVGGTSTCYLSLITSVESNSPP